MSGPEGITLQAGRISLVLQHLPDDHHCCRWIHWQSLDPMIGRFVKLDSADKVIYTHPHSKEDFTARVREHELLPLIADTGVAMIRPRDLRPQMHDLSLRLCRMVDGGEASGSCFVCNRAGALRAELLSWCPFCQLCSHPSCLSGRVVEASAGEVGSDTKLGAAADAVLDVCGDLCTLCQALAGRLFRLGAGS